MTERNKTYYVDFVVLTSDQYKHCTLEEKLAVYVQHRPVCVVPFLLELIGEVSRLEGERQFAIDEAQRLENKGESLSREIDDLRGECDDNRNTIIELRERYDD